MIALLSWRVWAAVIVSIFLIGSHWKAYKAGEKEVQFRWNEEHLVIEKQALAASEANRQKENALRISVERVRSDYSKEKAAHAATATRLADSLRSLTASLDSAATSDPTAPGGVNDPRGAIAGECAGALIKMDGYAAKLADQTTALQGFTRSVCVR